MERVVSGIMMSAAFDSSAQLACDCTTLTCTTSLQTLKLMDLVLLEVLAYQSVSWLLFGSGGVLED